MIPINLLLFSRNVIFVLLIIFDSLEIKDVVQYLVSRLYVGTVVQTEIIINDSHFMYVEGYIFLLFPYIRDHIIIDLLHKMILLDVETYFGY